MWEVAWVASSSPGAEKCRANLKVQVRPICGPEALIRRVWTNAYHVSIACPLDARLWCKVMGWEVATGMGGTSQERNT